MKRTLQIIVAASLLLTLNHLSSTASAQGTAFTYQGQLQNNGAPASGVYNLQFTLYTNSTGGTAVSGPVTNKAVAISNGLFTVAIDFGSSVWNGETNWLQIGVESNNITIFTNLAPRQPLTPVPYAITAQGLSGNILGSQLAGGDNNNFFVGPAGNTTLTGSFNTAIGSGALVNDISGIENTAYGTHALENNTTGTFNTANGGEALSKNTSGSDNTANGLDALQNNLTGSDNTANGYDALNSNTNGSENTAVGADALQNNVNGSDNIALGDQAGYFIITGSSNIDIGNMGVLGDTNIIRIGSGQSQAFIAGNVGLGGVTTPQQTLSLNGGMNIDQGDGNVGSDNNNALTFGSASGEGIASKRTSGGSQDDLEFYTAFDQRMLILNNGNVGIGETNPAGALHITGPASAPPSTQPAGDNGLILGTTGTSGYKWIQSFGGPLVLNPTSNNVGIDNTSPTHLLVVGNSGSPAYCDGTTWQNGSDRNSKQDFAAVNPLDVLDKVDSLPITEWRYKVDEQGLKHLGPMAQDFHAAFELNGPDDKHIATVDEGGVALAAIQGLNQKLEADNAELKQENNLLAKRLDELEAEVKALARNSH